MPPPAGQLVLNAPLRRGEDHDERRCAEWMGGYLQEDPAKQTGVFPSNFVEVVVEPEPSAAAPVPTPAPASAPVAVSAPEPAPQLSKKELKAKQKEEDKRRKEEEKATKKSAKKR